MSSLKYLIANMDVDKTKQTHRDRKQRPPITDKSYRSYKDYAIKFGEWCKASYGCRKPSDCVPHIQSYADYLVYKGLSASTVHTYLAGVCRWFNVPMDTIHKPRRVTADYTRSRGEKASSGRSDTKRGSSSRLYDFASVVGIRRNEYRKLTNADFKKDESKYYCVDVKRGKGGKHQMQRILPDDVEFVRSFFNGDSSKVFSESEMDNKLDLHALRGAQAKRAYQYYMNRLTHEDKYRSKLRKEIKKRFKENERTVDNRQIRGVYVLRGANKRLAIRENLPLQYDRLALMAVSVFHLSHWRLDVTVASYMLAVN